MTSLISKEDLEDELVRAGITNPAVRFRLLRKIELYSRRYSLEDPDLPPINLDKRGYKYICPAPPKGCGQRKRLAYFPDIKKVHPRSPIPCTECMKKKMTT